MENKAVVVGGNVDGNITSCKIENVVVRVDKKSATSFFAKETHITYDVCTKKEVSRYEVPSFTGFGTTVAFFVGMCLVAILFSWAFRSDY